MHVAHFCTHLLLRPRGKHEKGLVTHILVHTLTHAHKCLHLGTLLCQQDSKAFTQNVKTSAHTPSRTHSCTNIQTRASHIHAHTHSCVEPTDTHTGPSSMHIMHKSIFTHARVSQVCSDTHVPIHTAHETCIHKYVEAHIYTSGCAHAYAVRLHAHLHVCVLKPVMYTP